MQERLQMMREIERLKEEEMNTAIEKKRRAEALVAEVAAANAEQINRKEAMRQQEREDDLRIAEYIRHKDAREQVGSTT